MNANNRRRKDIYIIPIEDRELLEGIGYKERISATDKAIAANAEFLNNVIANPEIFGHDLDELEAEATGHSPNEQHQHSDRQHRLF